MTLSRREAEMGFGAKPQTFLRREAVLIPLTPHRAANP